MERTKSVVVKGFGSYDVLHVEDFPLSPLEGKIEVAVKYGGINFADVYTRQGLMPHEFPFVLGMEAVGTITAIGVEDTKFKIGQRVICYDYHCGMYSKTVRVSPDNVYPLPDDIPFQEGAAVFVNYLTAYFSVIELGNLRPNETILILSCAGGVGWAATQLAKNIEGVKIVGICSESKYPIVKNNGVHTALSQSHDLTEKLKEASPGGFDVIVTNYAGPLYGDLESLLKPLGRIVIIGANNLIQNENKLSIFTLLRGWWNTKNVKLEELITRNRVSAGLHLGTLIDSNPERVRDALTKIFEMLRQKKLAVRIHDVLPMERVADATRLLAERKNIGKVLISME